MVYKITLCGFRAFCTVRTAKTKPINNISILWGKHHLRTLCCDEGHSCCRKGCIPFAITCIVLCCFFMMSTSIFHQHRNMYMYIIALITSHECPSCLIFIPIFFFKFCYYRSGDQAYPKAVKSKSNFINSSRFIYFFVTKKKNQNQMTF